jgi:hypothetical protein
VEITAAGAVIVGTDPGGSELLRVGGTGRFAGNLTVTPGSGDATVNVTHSSGSNARINATTGLVSMGSSSATELRLITGNTGRIVISSGGDLHFNGGTPVSRPTFGAPTGTATQTTFATSTVTLEQLAERVKAMIDHFKNRGDFN